MRTKHTSGFTLVEIMIAVVIIGLLAAIALPALKKVRTSSQNSRLANDLRVFSSTIETYLFETGNYPEDSNSGAIPSELSSYINTSIWDKAPSIGGLWDVEKDSFNILSAIGVHRFTVPDEQLLRFDERYDDGNLESGTYRKLDNDRFYYIVAE